MGAARCGDVGARDVPRFAERPARDPRRARRRERDGNPRAYRQPGARLGARGDPFLRAVPGAGATLADEEIWRGHVRAGRAPMSTPSGILKRISASLIASYSSSCCPILPSLRRPVRLLSPAPRTPVREIAGKRFWVARVRGSVIHDPATRSERAGVSRDGRHVGRAIARRSTLRARRRVSASLSVEPATWGTSASEKRRQDVVRPDRDGRLQKTVRIPATASTRRSGSRRRDRRDWGVSNGTTMAGPLMRMPNGQMIVSFDARSPKIHQNAPPPQPTISRPALFQPRSRLTAVAPLPPPFLLPPTATPDRAPARGHGHEPG